MCVEYLEIHEDRQVLGGSRWSAARQQPDDVEAIKHPDPPEQDHNEQNVPQLRQDDVAEPLRCGRPIDLRCLI